MFMIALELMTYAEMLEAAKLTFPNDVVAHSQSGVPLGLLKVVEDEFVFVDNNLAVVDVESKLFSFARDYQVSV